MKRALSCGVLVSNWIVGLILFFHFPPETNTQLKEVNQTTLQSVNGEKIDSFQTPESVSFEIEWKLLFPIQSAGLRTVDNIFSFISRICSTYTTLSFFDVKQLFIHFFHTW